MFDFSWTEGLVVAALAIIVVGPRDLPRLARTAGSIMQKGRRIYRDAISGMHRLEQEIDLASKPANNGRSDPQRLLPEEVRSAMIMDAPHGDADKHRRADAAFRNALADIETERNNAAGRVSVAATDPHNDSSHEQ